MPSDFPSFESLAALSGAAFDVAVIGGGINGASAAQHLAAAGYSVLLVDKGDFGSGSSGRSSRLLHCGLRYLAPGRSLFDFVRHPSRLAAALRMAGKAMEARAEFVGTSAEQAPAMRFCFPLFKGGPYRGWHVDLAFKLLDRLGSGGLPLDYERVPAEERAWLVGEANRLLPQLRLAESDVLMTWAGVRPLTYDENTPTRSPDESDSAPLLPEASVKLSDLRHAVRAQHARTLMDALYRRVGPGWRCAFTPDELARAADVIGGELGWSEARKEQEVQSFQAEVALLFDPRPALRPLDQQVQ